MRPRAAQSRVRSGLGAPRPIARALQREGFFLGAYHDLGYWRALLWLLRSAGTAAVFSRRRGGEQDERRRDHNRESVRTLEPPEFAMLVFGHCLEAAQERKPGLHSIIFPPAQ